MPCKLTSALNNQAQRAAESILAGDDKAKPPDVINCSSLDPAKYIQRIPPGFFNLVHGAVRLFEYRRHFVVSGKN